MTTPSGPSGTSAPLRVRLIERAAAMTGQDGWSALTMGRLADAVGVSRQTVYNEIGGKPALAEAMVMHELALFLAEVDEQFAAHDDLGEAIRGAVTEVLRMARSNPLLRAILSTSHGADSDLLPLLTTQADALIEAAAAVVRGQVERFDLDLTPGQIDAGCDMVVRLVLSHVMQPGGEPAEVAADVTWIAARVLDLDA